MKIEIPIMDHVAAAERMCQELLLVCPDPNLPDFEGRDEELRMNSAIRATLHEAADIIEHQHRLREIHKENAKPDDDPVLDALRGGMSVGEETAAKRLISRFALAFNGF